MQLVYGDTTGETGSGSRVEDLELLRGGTGSAEGSPVVLLTAAPVLTVRLYWTTEKLAEVLAAHEEPPRGFEGFSRPGLVELQFAPGYECWKVQYAVAGEMVLTCGRCLERIVRPFEVHGQVTVRGVPRERHGEESEVHSDDLDTLLVPGDRVVLEDLVREALNEAVPEYPRCETECNPPLPATDAAPATGSLAAALTNIMQQRPSKKGAVN